jgi:hypothetical protein
MTQSDERRGTRVDLTIVNGKNIDTLSDRAVVPQAVETSNIIRIVQLTLLTTVAAFGISVVVFGHWWSPPPSQLDMDALGKQITSAMQNQFDTGDGTKELGLHVVTDNVTLINTKHNEYQGLVHVTTHKGTDVEVGLVVYADASTGHWIYEMDPGSRLKLSTAAEKDKDPMKQTCWGPQC